MSNPLDRPPLCVIQQGKAKSIMLAEAIIRGNQGHGRILYAPTEVSEVFDRYMPVFIGVHPTTVGVLHDLAAAGRPYVTVDNGYFRPYQEGGYFRATSNALQWVAKSARDMDYYPHRAPLDPAIGRARWDALDIELQPWDHDKQGHKSQVLLALQSPVWLEMMREPKTWLKDVQKKFPRHRPVVVREKPLKGAPPQPPLEQQIAKSHAVVAYSSAVLLKALIAGVPVFPQAHCAASPLGIRALEFIDTPTYPPRETVLHELAANQWTIPEIESGRMWAELRDRYEPEFMKLG